MSADDGTRYFEIAFDHDKDAHGNLPPAAEVSVTVLRPVKVTGGSIEMAPQNDTVVPMPGTRIFATADPITADSLALLPTLREIDKPSSKELKSHRDSSTAYEAAQNARYAGLDADDPERNPDNVPSEA